MSLDVLVPWFGAPDSIFEDDEWSDRLLPVVLSRILRQQGQLSLHLVTQNGRAAGAAERAADLGLCAILNAETQSLVGAAVAFSSKWPDRTVVCLAELGLCLAPEDLLLKLLQFHQHQDSWLTSVSGLPAGVAPLLIERRLLDVARQVTLPTNSDVGALWSIVEVCQGAPDPRLNVARTSVFDAKLNYGLISASMPEAVDFSFGQSRRTMATFIEAQAETWASRTALSLMEALRAWRLHTRDRQIKPAMPLQIMDTERIRVLTASNRSAYSGAEASLCNVMKHIDKARFECVTLVGTEGYFSQRLRHCGSEVITHCRDFSQHSLDSFQLCAKVISEFRPHIVHISGSSGIALPAVAKLYGARLIYHIRTRVLDQAAVDTIHCSDRLIAVSGFVKRLISDLEIEDNTIHVVYGGVDCDVFFPMQEQQEEMRSKLGLISRLPVVLMIARYAQYKRHDLLIRAASRILADGVAFQVVMVGESSIESPGWEGSMRALADELRVPVNFLGFNPEIRDVHAASDILVLCSDGEPLGICAIEAMAMGLPVIVSDTSGIAEVITDGVDGMVFPGGDQEALTNRLRQLLSSAEVRAKLGAGARDLARTVLSSKVSAAKLEAIYVSLYGTAPLSTVPVSL